MPSVASGSLCLKRYMRLTPKATAKAPYPMKQVTTWAISQLLLRAGMSGWMRSLMFGDSEA